MARPTHWTVGQRVRVWESATCRWLAAVVTKSTPLAVLVIEDDPIWHGAAFTRRPRVRRDTDGEEAEKRSG